MRYLLFIAMLMLMLAGVPDARADVVDIQWSGDGRFTHRGAIAAGTFVEVCGKLPAGLAVRWDFEASTPVDFNVHYHEGKDVVFPAELSAVASAKGTLNTKIEQDYCWMWSNKTEASVSVFVQMSRTP